MIASATAQTPGRIYSLSQGRQVVAALLLSQTEGVTGLYSLCVRSDLRGRGIGAGLARFAIGQAQAAGDLSLMQCEPSLCAWYERLGYASCGEILGFARSKPELSGSGSGYNK